MIKSFQKAHWTNSMGHTTQKSALIEATYLPSKEFKVAIKLMFCITNLVIQYIWQTRAIIYQEGALCKEFSETAGGIKVQTHGSSFNEISYGFCVHFQC